MSTYQANPAFQTYQSSPYALPTQQIAQAISTRNSYWDLAASELKDTYKNLLGLDITRSDNKQKLDGYMNQANYKLKTVVQSDLSIAPNAYDAMKIFDPIVKDQNIMGDHAITSHYRDQIQQAERLKLKGTGDEYSKNNVSYLLQGLDEYSKDPNASNWQSYYSQKRYYTPYYDTSKEIRDLMKNFKPSETSITTPDVDSKGNRNSEYLITKKDKSSYESQLKAYLSANLSDKARQQLSIDGSVAYYGNDDVLKSDYMSYNNNKLGILNIQGKDLKSRIQASSDDDEKKILNSQLSNVEESIESINKENHSTLSDGSFLQRNRDRISGSIYTDSYMRNISASNQRVDKEVTYKPDQAALKHFSEDMENQRLYYKLSQDAIENQLDRDSREKIAGIKKGTGTVGDLQGKERPQTASIENEKTFGVDTLDKSITNAKSNLDVSRSNLMEAINEDRKLNGQKDFDISKLPKDQIEPFMEQWSKEHQKDPMWQTYLTNKRIFDNQNAVKDQVWKDAQTDLNPNETITVTPWGSKPITITSKDKYTLSTGTGSLIPAPGYVPNNQWFANINGKQYQLSSADYDRIRSSGSYAKINDALNKKVTILKNEKVPTVDQQKDPTIKAMRENFASQFGIKENAAKDLRVYSYDKDGVYFSIPSTYDAKELGISADALKTTLEARGGKVVTREGFPTYFLPYSQTSFTPKILTDPELKPFQEFFDFKKSGKVNGSIGAPETMTYDPNRIGEYFTFKMDLMNGVPQYKIFHMGSKTFIGDPSKGFDGGFDSLEDASAFIFSNFTDKKQFANQLQAIKNRNK